MEAKNFQKALSLSFSLLKICIKRPESFLRDLALLCKIKKIEFKISERLKKVSKLGFEKDFLVNVSSICFEKTQKPYLKLMAILPPSGIP
jgi:hypothetical protein